MVSMKNDDHHRSVKVIHDWEYANYIYCQYSSVLLSLSMGLFRLQYLKYIPVIQYLSWLYCVLQLVYLTSVLSLVHCSVLHSAAALLVVEWQDCKTGSVPALIPFRSLETSSIVSSTVGCSLLLLCSWTCTIGTLY